MAFTFPDATTGFPAKNKRRISILMTCHYPDLGSATDWLCFNYLLRKCKPTVRLETPIHFQTNEFLTTRFCFMGNKDLNVVNGNNEVS